MGYPVDPYMSNLTMAMAMMVPVALLLMPLYVALVGGDLVAKEAEDGTLRMILSRPVSRLRIVTIKWLAGALFSVVLVIVLGISGIAFASVFFPPGNMFAVLPVDNIFGLFDLREGAVRYASAIGLMTFMAVTVMGIGWMFSCFNMKPAAATILALSVFLVSRLIQEIPYFHDLQAWFITYHTHFWMKVFAQPIPWPDMCQSVSILFGFNLTFFIIGAVAFQVRDIKS